MAASSRENLYLTSSDEDDGDVITSLPGDRLSHRPTLTRMPSQHNVLSPTRRRVTVAYDEPKPENERLWDTMMMLRQNSFRNPLSSRPIQYRIHTPISAKSWLESDKCAGGLLFRYVRWTFKANLFGVVVSACAIYLLFVVSFAVILSVVHKRSPACFSGIEEAAFMDLFHLSWTTLSTVGYGVISAGLPRYNGVGCLGINFLLAFEAFFGVIFSSVVGAIIFGKVALLQSFASVQFSKIMCLRYGEGAKENSPVFPEHSSTQVDDDDEEEDVAPPFPLLEFRLINQMSSVDGAAIVDATVNVVACVLEDHEENDDNIQIKNTQTMSFRRLSNATALFNAGPTATGRRGSSVQRINWALAGLTSHHPTDSQPANSEPFKTSKEEDRGTNRSSSERGVCIEVDEGSHLAPPRKYHKLEIETDKHPYFHQNWIIRHVLDENSPLVVPRALRQLRSRRGMWPFKSPEDIRKHIRFSEIIVNFSGTANASGNTVFAQKLYTIEDVFVGYTFANLLNLRQGRLVAEASLLNDIHEQQGGGGEPISNKLSASEESQ